MVTMVNQAAERSFRCLLVKEERIHHQTEASERQLLGLYGGSNAVNNTELGRQVLPIGIG